MKISSSITTSICLLLFSFNFVTQTFAAPIAVADANGDIAARDNFDFDSDLVIREPYPLLEDFTFDVEARSTGSSKAPATGGSHAGAHGGASGSTTPSIDPLSGVKQSSNPSDWPSDSKMTSLFVGPKDGSVFWSGRDSKGGEILHFAVDFAKKKGGSTLDMIIRKEGLVVAAGGTKEGSAFWDKASGVFAKNAKGVVYVVMGDQMRQGNVWERVEFPTLKANKAVTKVVKVTSAGKEEPIWPAGKK
jgi:hypothetical protein